MFQRVLICTDFADGLQRLTNFVSSLALAGMKQIVFLHAVPLWEKGIIPQVDTEKIEQAQTQLAKTVDAGSTDVEVNIEVQSGKPVDIILKVAQSYQSQLIILGSQSRNLLTEKLVGSTMADLSHKTTIPLLVLRPQLISTYTAEELKLRCQHLFRSLLLPYNGTPAANYLVQQVKQLAQQQSEPYIRDCTLCWVLEEARRRDLPQKISPQQAQESLSKIKADLQEVNLQVETEVRQGYSINQILEAATMVDISAIALSSATIGTVQEWLVSSFAAELLRFSWYPVLFFPPQRR
ncbi:universal stress protein [Calothrix sp. FACHB-1219]|uniref:universal stress protein n=1 Tax=unclassified Calothrix TaxID=2619626 RepID=UPI00168792EF|nr:MULTISPECIES: universal stress protein [unclassified Calothrix]MBD2202632.1 universal stress protein [Calothrix sp. FACHB-168]MBD2221738.1 universal stress protein [Calothrix sp. FACHB-1219]